MGSITLARGGTTITLTSDLSIKRQVGRPNSELRPKPDNLPNYIDRNRAASDVWVISGAFTSGTPEADAKTLREDIIRPPLGRGALTLTFDSSLYGLSSFTVFPEGSRAARTSYSAGSKGIVRVDTLELRVVTSA